MQPAADLSVLQLAQVAVDLEDELVELAVVGDRRPALAVSSLEAEVPVDLGLHHQLPHLAPDRRQLGRVEGGDAGMLVEQRLEASDVVVGVRPGERRHQVVDDDGVSAAFGLGSFAGVVHDEGIDERHVGEGEVGIAACRQAGALPRQPFERAVLSEVDDGVCTEAGVEPAIETEVVVRRRQHRGVVDGDRVLAEAPRRLDGDEHAAEVDPREHEGIALRRQVHPSRRLAPVLGHLAAHPARDGPEPGAVVRNRKLPG